MRGSRMKTSDGLIWIDSKNFEVAISSMVNKILLIAYFCINNSLLMHLSLLYIAFAFRKLNKMPIQAYS